MSEPTIIKAALKAWLSSPKYTTVDDILSAAEKSQDQAADMLIFSNSGITSRSDPWLEVGSAEITVTLLPRKAVTANHIKSLESELQAERAASQMRQNAILDRISKLQCLENTPS